MRDATGGPRTRIRLLALLTAVVLLLISAPALVPLLRWAWGLLT